MPTHTTKPNMLAVEAFKWDGNKHSDMPCWAKNEVRKGNLVIHHLVFSSHCKLEIKRKDGSLTALPGEYIIRYPSGNMSHLSEQDFNYCFKAV